MSHFWDEACLERRGYLAVWGGLTQSVALDYCLRGRRLLFSHDLLHCHFPPCSFLHATLPVPEEKVQVERGAERTLIALLWGVDVRESHQVRHIQTYMS
jgi:hypothetical protein